ncbi:sigma-E factor negative regulatory protein [Chitinibacter bivalviorum]|uniref:Sigma-E factor negative regulatory protein n=1 Tax=Chitinibacter bivalviorum TaxID=2739434 RepID=A0A7H9BH69_9NEIS|nr:sigma-E factor negative regulatory protein [Chitinibacter bivalviorum]QLG87967.1 sigma-E factor negative regulatory protein [Chitinibacter bivalviorum]
MMNEKLSALMDNELDPAQWGEVLDALKSNPVLQQQWHDWHMSKDVLQGNPSLSSDFMAKFSARLAAEPIVLAPNRLPAPKTKRWMVPMAAAASVAFVGLAVWQFTFHAAPAAQPQMASVQAVMQQGHVDAAEVRAYLAAHRDGVSNPMGADHLAQVSFEVGEQR